jgi:ABC-type transport system substrate-binding protein
VLNGQGSLVNTDPSLDKLQYDPERAQFLLEEAGYGREGIYIAYADDISRKMAEYMVESLAVIKVSAKVIDSPDSLAAIYVRPAQ